MTDKEFQLLMDLFKRRLAEPKTKEDAIRNFQDAGMMDEHGEFKPRYKNLELALALDLGQDRY